MWGVSSLLRNMSGYFEWYLEIWMKALTRLFWILYSFRNVVVRDQLKKGSSRQC